MTGPLSVPQVATRWGKPRSTILRWVQRGMFPHAFQVGNRWLIPAADVALRKGTEIEAAAS